MYVDKPENVLVTFHTNSKQVQRKRESEGDDGDYDFAIGFLFDYT